MDKIKCGIIGATGYAGAEIVRLLISHPSAEIAAVSSVSYEGMKLSEIWPALSGLCDLPLISGDDITDGKAECDVVFAALPAGVSEEMAEKCVKRGILFIDMGADFRFSDAATYEKWYGKSFAYPGIHNDSVYCIPELHRDRIKPDTLIIGNPGCYPTSVALGIMPAIKYGLIGTDRIIIDSKSGVTGAGRKLTQDTHFPDNNESFNAYKAGSHRHTPEIEQTVSELAGHEVKVTFVPHLLPVNRGILSTIYADMKPGTSLDDVYSAYSEAYRNEFFVRLEPKGSYANIRNVRRSNFCDISLHSDEHTGTLIITSCIDNMVKGAAGQAIQNMNIRFGIPENTGLTDAPTMF